MTNEERLKLVNTLRDEGFAVVVFTAEELRGADPDLVEDLMVERGWNAIEALAKEGQDEIEPEIYTEATPLDVIEFLASLPDAAAEEREYDDMVAWAVRVGWLKGTAQGNKRT